MSIAESKTSEIKAAPVENTQNQVRDDFYSPKQFIARVYNRLLIFLVVYVLSVGPLYWYWFDSKFFRDISPFFARLYNPLDKFCEICPAFSDWLGWYISLWK
jgi:hypothetical protein